jgi:hypothetical protein
MIIVGLFLFFVPSLADKTVYLERPGEQASFQAQPIFNPSTLHAELGEKVQFIARFDDQRPYYPDVLLIRLKTLKEHRDILHLDGDSRNVNIQFLVFTTVVTLYT